jgi:DNA polymerase-3 subunit gamma/tau
MRDAFTLFDQVVSFSAGNIRSELIREKLGITGLEKLNALAQACAENDSPSAFALTDEILSSGVAIEQFVIDLAGFYRSLLLLKNGVTRESLLGYRPSLFSAKALETYDSIRLEQALDILLDCYRDIRYSVSPRFELETAVSKLTWLSKWVSPAELKEAVDDARGVLGNSDFPKRSAAPQKKTETVYKEARTDSASQRQPSSSGGRSLADELQRIAAAKEAGGSEEEDVPLWDSAVHKKTENEIPPQVERVLSMIPGTVVP